MMLTKRRNKVTHLVAAISVITFVTFIVSDPRPSILMSVSAALNVAIICLITYRFYQYRLLLSPVTLVYAGPSVLLYYSWGNLAPRMSYSDRYASSVGSIDFYPAAAVYSTFGLLMFSAILFGPLWKYISISRIRFQDLLWTPQQVVFSGLISVVVLTYMSVKYPFTSGYFRGVDSSFDQWLAATQYMTVTLFGIVSISVSVRGASRHARSIGFVGCLSALVITLGLRSRTSVLILLVMFGLCWLTLRPKQVKHVLVAVSLLAIASYMIGSVVKASQGNSVSISDNLRIATRAAEMSSTVETTRRLLSIDAEYRQAAFEYPAVVLHCLENGIPPTYGQGMLSGAMGGLPGFLRPNGVYSERAAYGFHFMLNGCSSSDTIMGLPLTSGLADWGEVGGLLIYGIIALVCVATWRIAQLSVRCFLAYLLLPAIPDLLFWDRTFVSVRFFAFAFIFLWLLHRLLAPTWVPQKEMDDACHGMPMSVTSNAVSIRNASK